MHGGDLIWQISSGYFGYRDADGKFSAENFKLSASQSSVRMIEIKLSQGAKPGGKPVGIKLCVGQPWEFFAIAKAMLETGSCPDFITVDGSEGGTGAGHRLSLPIISERRCVKD